MTPQDVRRSLARSLLPALALSGCTPTHAPPKAEEAKAEAPVAPTPPPAVEAPPEPPPKTHRQARPRSLAVSHRHACAIEGAGRVACWGHGGSGQLGPGREEHSPTPVRVAGIDDAVAVAVAREASCALRADHALSCWGRFGAPAKIQPTLVTSRALGEVVEFALVEGAHTVACARRKDGTIACAPLGATGAGKTIAGIDDAVGIEVFHSWVFVLRASGALDSFVVPHARDPEPTPERVNIGDVVDIARIGGVVGGLCALLSSGQMRCRSFRDEWKPEVPTAGPLWKTKLPAALWATALDYSSEGQVHCAREADGQVWCWGDNSYGQVGTGTPAYTTRPRSLFEAPMVAVSAGGDRSCGVREGGEVTCFEQASDEPVEVEGVRMLAAGNFHSCAIVGAGEARCWGFSEVGATGSPGPSDGLVRVQGLTDLALIAVAEDHSCAARRGGTLSCWGSAAQGQLGDGRFHREGRDEDGEEFDEGALKSESPIEVADIEGAITGLALGSEFSCAATSEGLYCWGSLPNPSAIDAAQIARPRLVLAGAVTAVDGEEGSLCAIDGEGGLHCWGPVAERYRGGAAVKVKPGRDDADPARFSRGGPLWKLGGLALEATAVAVGGQHACLLSGTGEVWCWGSNDEGQLGDGTTRDREEPVKVRGLPGPAIEIAAGSRHSCARVEGGRVLCWGSRTAPREHGRSQAPVRVVGLAPGTGGAAKEGAGSPP